MINNIYRDESFSYYLYESSLQNTSSKNSVETKLKDLITVTGFKMSF